MRQFLPVAGGLAIAASFCIAEDPWERTPVSYSETASRDPVAVLLDRGWPMTPPPDAIGRRERLRELLHLLEVPVESQTLVFSKTSLQTHRISPRHPRALYFSDDVYVG